MGGATAAGGPANGPRIVSYLIFPRISARSMPWSELGGYNTLVEAASKGVPTVCVPRTVPRREQLIRARALRTAGLLTVIETRTTHSETLVQAVQSVISHSRTKAGEPGCWRRSDSMARGGLPSASHGKAVAVTAGLAAAELARARGAPASIVTRRTKQSHMKGREELRENLPGLCGSPSILADAKYKVDGSFRGGLFAEVGFRLMEPWPLKFVFDRILHTRAQH